MYLRQTALNGNLCEAIAEYCMALHFWDMFRILTSDTVHEIS